MNKKNNNKYNIFYDCINSLKNDWFDNIKPFIEFDKPQGRKYDKFVKSYPVVGEPNPVIYPDYSEFGRISLTTKSPFDGCDDNPYEEINGLQFFNKGKAEYIEKRKIANILKSLHFQFIQKLSTEVMRSMLIACSELGYKHKDFSLDMFFAFSDGILKDKSKPKIETFPKYNAFNLLFKMNNFLKHNTVQAYLTLKKHYPDNIDFNNKTRYENGMYAGDFIYLQDGYLDKIFDKLLIFFAEYCKVILGENTD